MRKNFFIRSAKLRPYKITSQRSLVSQLNLMTNWAGMDQARNQMGPIHPSKFFRKFYLKKIIFRTFIYLNILSVIGSCNKINKLYRSTKKSEQKIARRKKSINMLSEKKTNTQTNKVYKMGIRNFYMYFLKKQFYKDAVY